jgi:hypothetical protein
LPAVAEKREVKMGVRDSGVFGSSLWLDPGLGFRTGGSALSETPVMSTDPARSNTPVTIMK